VRRAKKAPAFSFSTCATGGSVSGRAGEGRLAVGAAGTHGRRQLRAVLQFDE